jgi:arylsulfate sulfotransferase
MLGKFLIPICSFALLFCLDGCGSSNNDPAPAALTISPQPAFVGAGQSIQFATNAVTGMGGVTWAVTGSSGSIDTQGKFTASDVTQNSTVTVTVASASAPTNSASTTLSIIAPGTVAATANPQVAQYTISVPDGTSASVQFGTDTNYGFSTWAVPAPTGGGPVSILVAGMKGNTPYHMRAAFQPTGSTNLVFSDADHTFTTSSYPAANIPALTVTTTTGQTPQPGVELLDLISINGGPALSLVVTDLAGNVVWAYAPPTTQGANPIKLLPNGHLLINFSDANPDGMNSIVQEIDLTGQVVWQMTAAQLNAALAAASCSGCNIKVIGTHHDFAVLPNGHIIFLAGIQQVISGTQVTGDVLIDFDQNRNPVWLWNAFDHLDVNRHPMNFPDWLHSNSVVYSPDDKALMVSLRHQAWVIKINYNDGAGDGSVLWKLGYQGDFALQSGATNAVDPVDWFNAQHDANFVSSNTSGAIDILLFDNGNQRVLDTSSTLCGPSTTPCDSRVPILHVDESAKTADITWVDKLAPSFSYFGGSARPLKNGNVEFDECSSTTPPAANAAIFEVTKTTPPTIVWSMKIAGQNAYRGFRIPSLYPGVQW